MSRPVLSSGVRVVTLFLFLLTLRLPLFADGIYQGHLLSVDAAALTPSQIPRLLTAAQSGDVQAQVSLGIAYEYAYGVKKDYPAAINWYRKAAEQGNPQGQILLANMYAAGWGALRIRPNQ